MNEFTHLFPGTGKKDRHEKGIISVSMNFIVKLSMVREGNFSTWIFTKQFHQKTIWKS